MKKVILALAIVSLSGLFFASCKAQKPCDAYPHASAPAHNTGAKHF